MIHSYPWYIQDWLLSRARAVLNIEQRGLFREVLDILYNNEGTADPDEESLRRMCGAERPEWKRSWPAVKKLLDKVDGQLSHPKVRETIVKLEVYHTKRREAGRSGAKRRWKQADSSAIAEPQQTHSSAKKDGWQTDSPEAWQNDSLPQPLPLPQPQPLPHTRTNPADPPREVPEWEEFRSRYPKQDGVDAACRWWLIESERDPDFVPEVMAGLERHLKCDKWRNRDGSWNMRWIPHMDNFLGVPKGQDKMHGRLYKDHPVPWQPPGEDARAVEEAASRARLEAHEQRLRGRVAQ